MLSKVVDKDKGELENCYNGLGFRVESTRPEERIDYLCDLSKDYYNLLERTVNGETESFVYDNNVISMSKSGSNFYYLQDELGSPMYMTGTDGMAVSSYAFDDFGRNIDPFTGKQKKHGYTKQGNIIQPFAFTGYQEDEISGLKFAQARYYSADNGRFLGEDQLTGIQGSPNTLNKYLYCENSPLDYVDNNGKWIKRKDLNAHDGAAIAVMAVGTIAAGFGAAAIGLAIAASAPVSLPLIAAGAVVGAGVAYDASVISDWKNDKHANLHKACSNAAAGAAIGATSVWSVGTIAAEGVSGIATVLTNKYAKATLVGSVSGLSNVGTGGSFGAGFIGGAVNNLMTFKRGGFIGNMRAGFVGNTLTEALNVAEGTSTKSFEEIMSTSSIYALLQGIAGGTGDILGKAMTDKYSKAAWTIINDVLRQGPLGFGNYLIADWGTKLLFEKAKDIIFDEGGCE
ncbi:RHS repeat domain-containing protein [Butyrivibrio sp. AE2005]|uniref:RHS repeat domain-containing protein n=1 Tax=Butyrivibrio sp. AE2005 TaxID=1496722 RepID=UPI00047DECD5|nr:RHS repeat-associated core domain-containing protein [Butyrivibrio sp. AE2005]